MATNKATEVTDIQKYWKAVFDTPDDFSAWTYLLAFSEHTNNIEEARKAFEQFLSKWPYCYGYWNRYADMEKRNSHPEKAREIYEKGVEATPLSIELWLHYINFEMVHKQGDPSAEDALRRLYRRAVDSAGLDFKSDKLWEAFINWETSYNPTNALNLYDELLSIPTQHISKHFESMKRLISQYKPRELIGSDEFLEHQKSALGQDTSSSMDTDVSEESSRAITEQLMNSLTADQLKVIRNDMILQREKKFKQTLQELEKRKSFEENIRRPYFHVKPLESGQLSTWRDYTDFEIAAGNHKRIVFLFERCLVACAMYEEFWMKYVTYLLKRDKEMARCVFNRACNIHLRYKPHIHLAWAALEEDEGKTGQAEEILKKIDERIPKIALVQSRLINMYRRSGNTDKVKELYAASISNAETANGAVFYACKYARYLRFGGGSVEEARNVLIAENEKHMTNPRIYLQLLDLEMSISGSDRESRVVKILDKAIEAMPSIEDKLLFSQRKMEFLEDFGSEVSDLFSSYELHQKMLKTAAIDFKKKAKGSLSQGIVSHRNEHNTENIKPKK